MQELRSSIYSVIYVGSCFLSVTTTLFESVTDFVHLIEQLPEPLPVLDGFKYASFFFFFTG